MKKLMAVFAVIALIAFAAPAFAAANPFMDVPAGHWAYDAVAQLAARGVVSGYPDGAYKGAQPATRYEMASVVARAMTRIDMEKASRQDVEIMKRLMLEFKDELDALGVKVDQLDKRVAKLEDGVGGWHIRGVFRFDAKFGDSDTDTYAYNRGGQNEFTKERFRLFLTKTIDENTFFYAQYRTGDNAGGAYDYEYLDHNGDPKRARSDGRGDMHHGRWSHLFVDTKLPWEVGLRVGRFAVDFEGDYGFYTEEDALWGDFRTDGFRLTKSWGMLKATAAIGRNDAHNNAGGSGPNSHMTYVLDLNVNPNEKFFVGATGYWGIEDSAPIDGDFDVNTYALYGGFNFTPAIQLKGIYYFQDLGENVAAGAEDSPTAWKAILDVKQEALKFTSLWLEYGNQDNNFWGGPSGRYGIGGNNYGSLDDFLGAADADATSEFFLARAKQQWNDKWSTYVRYGQWNFDTDGMDDTKTMGLGVGYQYTPAIYFELAYDMVDYGDIFGINMDKESVFRFRTNVNF